MARKGLLLYYQLGLNCASFANPIGDDFTVEEMYARHVPLNADTDFLDTTLKNQAVSDDVEEAVKRSVQ